MSARKHRRLLLTVLMLVTGFFVQTAEAAVLHQRVVRQWPNPPAVGHPGFLQVLPDGSLLVVNNSYEGGSVARIAQDGAIWWEFGPIQANSAIYLENGNYLIASSGLPGLPGGQSGARQPEVLEVDGAGRVVWRYALANLGLSPQFAERTSQGTTLITTPRRIIEVDPEGREIWSFGTGLLNAFNSTRLKNGNTLIVDQGIYRGSGVLEVNPGGQAVWSYGGFSSGSGQLRRPTAARRLDDGSTLIADAGALRLLQISSRGELLWEASFSEVLPDARMQVWFAVPTVQRQVLLAASYGNGPAALVEIDDRSLQVVIEGKVQLLMNPVMVADRVFLPMREVFQALGAVVHWDDASGTVTAAKGDRRLLIRTRENEVYLNDLAASWDAFPRMVGDRLFVPVRLVGESLGLEVYWDAGARIVYVGSTFDQAVEQ